MSVGPQLLDQADRTAAHCLSETRLVSPHWLYVIIETLQLAIFAKASLLISVARGGGTTGVQLIIWI